MSKNKDRRGPEGRPLCGEVGPGDGVDPRKYFHESRGEADENRARRLCGGVRRTLALLLPGDLRVVSVEARAGGPLHVTVEAPAGTARAAEARLAAMAPWLRAEVAETLRRKRAPMLAFRAVEPGAADPGGPQP